MKEITIMCNEVAAVDTESRQRAKTIYAMCRAVTPQFYKHSREEMKQAVDSIQILTENIDPELLARMCDMAIREYPKTHSAKSTQYFDINYILTFYNKAWEMSKPNDFNVLVERRANACIWGKIEYLDFEKGYPKNAPTWTQFI